MNRILVTIIIPVYNVADWIERCLLSVCNQTYTNIECIIVNDSTPDNSMQIVDRVLESYVGPIKFKVLTHEKNRGLSAARNAGVKNANGDYLFFLDSDDELPEKAIDNFVLYLNKYGDADFLIGNYIVEGDFNYIPLATPTILEGCDNIIRSYLKGKWYTMACGKLINRNFFEEHNLWFAERRLHEDILFSFHSALEATKIITLQEAVYKYIIRDESITTAKREKNYIDMFWIISKKIELVKERYDNKAGVCLYPYLTSNLLAYSILVSVSHLKYRKKNILLKWTKKQLGVLNRKDFSLKTLAEYYILSFSPCIIIGLCKLINRFGKK